ncbi:MAG TPA: DUF397 domain-containing protein [Streptosporangiaceae bacterium]|nr:DUF397 domain-containing protein [Streptosporangiaceae bacterium]
MSEYDTSNAEWITSRACNNSACVQVAHLPGGMVALRDSKDTTKPAHVFDGEEWVAFVVGVKAGDFDAPLT